MAGLEGVAGSFDLDLQWRLVTRSDADGGLLGRRLDVDEVAPVPDLEGQ